MENIDVDDPYRIVAMTYNVCFGCMYSDFSVKDGKESGNSKFDATSRELVKLCSQKQTDNGKNICLTNIQTVFESTKTQFSSLDLVGLQEASNWEQLIKASVLTSLSYVHHKALSADMVSLYNHIKFKLDAFIVGNITSEVLSYVNVKFFNQEKKILEEVSKPRNIDGRPYQLLFLTHRVSKQKYIFINIHNSHLYSREDLVNALGKEIRALKPNDNMTSFSNCNYNTINSSFYTIYDVYTDIIKDNKYEIIFMGDTNDHERRYLWKEDDKGILFTPLAKLGITTTVSSKDIQPPNSCCSGRRNLRPITKETIGYVGIPQKDWQTDDSMDIDDKYGDYILISTNLKYEENKNNVIPKFPTNAKLFPTSDHLPVVSVIILPQASAQGGSRRHRRKHKSARQLRTRNRHKHKQTKLKNTKTKRIYKK